ncbi:MAG: hypothetical protein M3Q29_24890 [Chloroflexota bacterium]|nr:hypothetical protein [Chloroflexota bacterium]
MTDLPLRPVAGIRLQPSGPLLWVECAVSELQPGSLSLLHTPGGDRSARVMVAPQHVLTMASPLSGHLLLHELSEDEALTVEPAAALRDRVEEYLRALHGVRASVAPDGSRVTLLADTPELAGRVAGELSAALEVPVVVRNHSDRLPEPPLPELMQEITYGDKRVTVVRISVFRGTVTLRDASGETFDVPLSELV